MCEKFPQQRMQPIAARQVTSRRWKGILHQTLADWRRERSDHTLAVADRLHCTSASYSDYGGVWVSEQARLKRFLSRTCVWSFDVHADGRSDCRHHQTAVFDLNFNSSAGLGTGRVHELRAQTASWTAFRRTPGSHERLVIGKKAFLCAHICRAALTAYESINQCLQKTN